MHALTPTCMLKKDAARACAAVLTEEAMYPALNMHENTLELQVVNDHGVQGDIYDLGSSQQKKAWDLEDLQSVGFLKSDPSPQNTQSKPVLENTNMDIIDGETPMKKGVGVVTKHLKRRKVDVTVDKSVEAKRTPRNKKERRSFPVQRLPLESRTLYHGRTWLKVGLGEKEVDCDSRWEKEHMMLRLADIVDLNNGERALMAVWNSFLSNHSGRALRHMDKLTHQFVREKGWELVELGLYRNCVLHLTALQNEGLITGDTVLNCIITFQETAREAPGAMVESWVEGRQLVLEQCQEAANADENLKTPVKRCKINWCEEDFETPQAGFCEQGLEVLIDQNLEVLTERDNEHEVFIDLGLSKGKEEGVMSGIGYEVGICEGGVEVLKDPDEGGQEEIKGLGKGGVEGLNNLVEGGLEELKLATEDVNSTQDSGVSVLLGEGEGPRREVVELYTILEGGDEGGEIEMFHISKLEDDLGEVRDENSEVEIVMQKEPEEKQVEEDWAAFEVETNPGKENVVFKNARDKSARRQHNMRTVTKREFFLRLRK